MATEQSTRAGSPETFGTMQDISSPMKATPVESLEGVAQSSSADMPCNKSCETTAPCPLESQREKTSEENCGTTAPSSLAGETEESSDENLRARLSELSLQVHEMDPRPSESAGPPKVNKPRAGPLHTPFADIFERLSPPRIVTIGRVIRTTAVEVELDQDFFRCLSRERLWMNVGLRDLDSRAIIDGDLKGQKSFLSTLPVPGLGGHGGRVLKFIFYAHSMRVTEYGSFRLFYSVHFADPRGFTGSKTLPSSGFVVKDSPDFTCDQMEFIDEQERQGHLRLRQDGGIDIVVARSG